MRLLSLCLFAVLVSGSGQQPPPPVKPRTTADLTTAQTKTVAWYAIDGMTYHRQPSPNIIISYYNSLGEYFSDRHLNPDEADPLVTSINKVTQSTKSLEQLLLEHLIAEGKIPPAKVVVAPVTAPKKDQP
jgi:hypothetical protein